MTSSCLLQPADHPLSHSTAMSSHKSIETVFEIIVVNIFLGAIDHFWLEVSFWIAFSSMIGIVRFLHSSNVSIVTSSWHRKVCAGQSCRQQLDAASQDLLVAFFAPCVWPYREAVGAKGTEGREQTSKSS